MGKKIKVSLALLLVITCLCGSTLTYAATVKLSKTSVTLTVGKSTTLKMQNTTAKVTWSTSDKAIAKVTSAGKVTAVKAGTATITAKVSGKSYTCKVTVKNANATAVKLTFRNTSNGDFIQGVSKATVAFTLDTTSTAVQVKIMSSLTGKSVYTKTFSKCEEDTEYTFAWDGKKTNGKYASEGEYTAVIKAGTKTTESEEITFYTKSDFSGGDGSKKKPYIVSSMEELAAVGRHNGMYFEQSKDLDAGYESFASLFTTDVPFVGSYDGKGHTIEGILNTGDNDNVGIFKVIGEGGSVSNLVMKDCTFSGYKYVGIIAGQNYGTVTNCTVKECVVNSSGQYAGGICGFNYGKILSCTFSENEIKATGIGAWNYGSGSSYVGGVCGESSGTINECKGTKDTISGGGEWVGGITGSNTGTVMRCTVTDDTITGGDNVGGISGYNSGTVSRCEVKDSQGKFSATFAKGAKRTGGIIGRNDNGISTNNIYTGELKQIGNS